MSTTRLTTGDMVALLVRVEGRSRIELGFPVHDAILLWPDAVDRIFIDEWQRLTIPADAS